MQTTLPVATTYMQKSSHVDCKISTAYKHAGQDMNYTDRARISSLYTKRSGEIFMDLSTDLCPARAVRSRPREIIAYADTMND